MQMLILIICAGLLLCACTVRSDAADLYKKESPIQVKVVMPEVIPTDKGVTVQAVLTQDKQKIEKADFVHFEIWKQDGSVRFPMEEAVELGGGVYQMEIQFEKNGLYYLDVHTGNNGAVSSPRQQFIVGEPSEAELEELKEGPVKEDGSSGHHH